jgi:hypothetical protein
MHHVSSLVKVDKDPVTAHLFCQLLPLVQQHLTLPHGYVHGRELGKRGVHRRHCDGKS